jgi:hypothetical protein
VRFLKVGPMPSLITLFRQVPDPGTGNAQRQSLLDMLVIATGGLGLRGGDMRGLCRVRRGSGASAAGISGLENGCRAMTPSAGWSGCGGRRPSGGCLRPFWTIRVPMAGGAGDQWQDAAPVVRPHGRYAMIDACMPAPVMAWMAAASGIAKCHVGCSETAT